jgi:hypothetical protein
MNKKQRAEIALFKKVIRILEKGYGTSCKTKDDWIDGEVLEEWGCRSCGANFVIHFLAEHSELS